MCCEETVEARRRSLLAFLERTFDKTISGEAKKDVFIFYFYHRPKSQPKKTTTKSVKTTMWLARPFYLVCIPSWRTRAPVTMMMHENKR